MEQLSGEKMSRYTYTSDQTWSKLRIRAIRVAIIHLNVTYVTNPKCSTCAHTTFVQAMVHFPHGDAMLPLFIVFAETLLQIYIF